MDQVGRGGGPNGYHGKDGAVSAARQARPRAPRASDAPAPRSERLRAAPVPALDPAVPYFSRLSARSALFTELHLLLDAEREPLSSSRYRALVIEENKLSRGSVAARRKLWQELKSRYRLESLDALFSAFWVEWQQASSDAEKALVAYVLLALNDRLVFELGMDLLFPLLRRAPAELRVADVDAFIARSAEAHPEVSAWTDKTRHAVAQKYGASIRDFGLAKGAVSKSTVRPALYGAPVRLIVRALRLARVAPIELVQAPAFRLLGLDATEVVDALGELNRVGALRFRMQGDIVELDVTEGG